MIDKYTLLRNFLVLLVSFLLYASAKAQVGNLLWEDNFNALNTQVWNPIEGNGCEIGLCGWGNAELEYYHPNNLTIEPIPGESNNNALVFTAQREEVGANQFTSGKVDSENKLSVLYGMIEIRMMVPNLETGLWPAAWLLGTSNIAWPAKGEIDMMEMGHAAAERVNQGHPNADINSYVGANAIFAAEDGSVASIAYDVNYNKPYEANTSMANRFVTYRLYWEPTQMRYTVVDGNTEYDLYEGPLILNPNEITGVFNKPFYFLMNLAVGGNFTDAANPTQVTASLPSKMYVDYVRVYEWNGYGEVTQNYSELAAESGNFGVFTEETSVDNQLTFGTDAEIFVWGGTMQNGTEAPNEGNNVIAWETLNADSWFGGGIIASYGKDMSAYVDNGSLHFDIKIPSNVGFRIGITDNFTNEAWIELPAGATTYGIERNGEWQSVRIPLVDFAGLVAFQNINYMFAISSIAESFPTETFAFALDNIYWTDDAEDTLSLDNFDSEQSTMGIFPTPAINEVNVYIPNSTALTRINIIDLAGNLVADLSTINTEILKIPVADLSSGLYLVKLFNGDKNTKVYKLIKA